MKRILKYIWRYKLLVILPTLAMLVGIALDMLNPYYKKVLVDDVIKGNQYGLLSKILIILAIITVSRAVFGYFKEFIFDVLSTKINIDLKDELFNHIQSLSFSYFDNKNTGELMSRIGEDVENIWRTVSFGLRLFIENVIYFVLTSVILFYINWKLALICLAIMFPIAYIAVKLEKKISKCYEDISDHTANLNTTAQENIAGVRLVKAFAREKHEISKFLRMNRKYYYLQMEQAKTLAKYFPNIEFLTNFSIIIMISIGGIFVINNEMTLGDLVAFSEYIWMLIWPMRMLGWLTNILAENNASCKKIFKILDTKPSIVNIENPKTLENFNGNIQFNNVSFQYDSQPILKNINLSVNPGDTVAIMGTTGSGKSTLVNLISRFYDISDGELLIDGINIKDIDLKDLRNRISIVPQDTFLFSESIEENIRFSNRNATDKEIIQACKDACALEFIKDLDEGFDSVIGERGIGLSGGQKQRLSIARALVKNTDILILDDSTSALDMDTEFTLLKNLNKRNENSNATTFIIAHRISAVKNADLILFMDNGEIVEKGTHNELLSQKGRYYEVYCEQFKDFEELEKEVI